MYKKRPSIKSRYIALTMILLFSSLPLNVSGLDESSFPLNDILFYGKGVICDTSSSGDTSTPVDTDNTSEYSNPVFSGVGQGPTVIRGDDGTYHAYLTSRAEKPLKHLTSTNMTTWKESDKQTISNLGELPTRSLWAPGVAKTGDHYTIVFAGIQGSAGFIGYGTSDSAGGPFKYRGKLKDSSDRARILDPSIYVEGDKIYVTYGSSPISIASLSMESDGELNMRNERTLLERGDRNSNGFPFTIEQSWIQKIGEWYYLFYSAGDFNHTSIGTANEYSVRVARSRSLDARFDSDNHSHVVIEGDRDNGAFRAPGASSIVQDAEGQYWMFYNAYKRPYGKEDRRLMLDRLETEDGWPVAAEGYPSTRSEAPIPGDAPGDEVTTSNGCVCSDPNGSPDAQLPGKNNAEKIWNRLSLKADLKDKDIHKAAIIGNWAQESSLDPKTVNSIGATGLAQWLGDRKSLLLSRSDPLTITTQVDFAHDEFLGRNGSMPQFINVGHTRSGTYEQWLDQSDLAIATEFFRRAYERPGEAEANDPDRIAAAQLAFDDFKGSSAPDTPTAQDCGDGGLVAGGMNHSEAERFMNTYSNSPDSIDYIGTSSRTCPGGALSNCVSFSAYFVNKYTTLEGMDGTGGPNGNGVDWVDNLLSRNPNVEGGDTPKPYSVFSTATSGGGAGHTGVVLGVDTERGVVITGEASCSSSSSGGFVSERSIESMSNGSFEFAYVEEFLKGGDL